MIDYRIDTFLKVCSTMSYTKAARELHITQPAVSQQIHYLESLYGCTLFSTEGRKIQLTDAGTLLFHTATTLKNDEHQIIEQMHSTPKQQLLVPFGTTMTIGEFIMPQPLACLIKEYPEAQIHMIIDNTNRLLQLLHTGDIHFAIVEGYYPQDEYEHILFQKEDFICVCSSEYSLSQKKYDMQELLPYRLLLREAGSGTRQILEKNLSTKNLSIHDFATTIEVNSMHLIRHLLLQGQGISFLYEAAVRDLLDEGRLQKIPLVDYSMKHDFTCIWNKGSIFGANYRTLCEKLQKYILT